MLYYVILLFIFVLGTNLTVFYTDKITELFVTRYERYLLIYKYIYCNSILKHSVWSHIYIVYILNYVSVIHKTVLYAERNFNADNT